MNRNQHFTAVWIAAILLVGVFTACKPDKGNFQDKEQGHLLHKYLKPYPDELTALLLPSDTVTLKAIDAYNTGQFENAAKSFPNYARNLEQAGYILLYKGISELMTGNDNEALITLQRIQTKMGESHSISQWYLALNYLSFNNVYEARQRLTKLADSQLFGHDLAKQLLKELPEN
ncbi:MAG: hypothetical protein R2795_12400 [Saprospiraceae bacterium]